MQHVRSWSAHGVGMPQRRHGDRQDSKATHQGQGLLKALMCGRQMAWLGAVFQSNAWRQTGAQEQALPRLSPRTSRSSVARGPLRSASRLA